MADHIGNGGRDDGARTSVGDLEDRLDVLWARYLTFLDDYTAAQTAIKKDMASGFLFLAQANFKSTGKRYGQDYYDQRAVASTRAIVADHGELPSLRIVQSQQDLRDHSKDGSLAEHVDIFDENNQPYAEKDANAASLQTNRQLPTPSPTPDPDKAEHVAPKQSSESAVPGDQPEESNPAVTNADSPAEPTKSTINKSDPLRWFGILLPPALRSAQQSFCAVVQDESSVAKAVNAARAMRETETDIRRTRKLLRKAERLASDATT